MSMKILRATLLILATVAGSAWMVACSKKSDANPAVANSDGPGEEEVLSDSFLNDDGTVDLVKMDAIFTREAEQNWGDDESIAGRRTGYVSINTALKTLSVSADTENPDYDVNLDGCSWEDVPNDNSQSDAWVPGYNRDEDLKCNKKLLKSQKIGDVYIMAIRGFAGYTTVLRAAVLTKHYKVLDSQISNDSPQSMSVYNQLVAPENIYTVRATKIFMPPQLDVIPYKGVQVLSEFFTSRFYNEYLSGARAGFVGIQRTKSILTPFETSILKRDIKGWVNATQLKAADDKAIYEALVSDSENLNLELRVDLTSDDWDFDTELTLTPTDAN